MIEELTSPQEPLTIVIGGRTHSTRGSARVQSIAFSLISSVQMSSLSSQTLQSRVLDRLAPHGSEGLRSGLAGVVDLDALEEGRYQEVLESVESRLSAAQYSLISMLVAGIYFGLLVGHWLFSLSSWPLVLRWSIPVLLVTIYAGYSSYHTIREIYELSEARILLSLLDRDQPSSARHAP